MVGILYRPVSIFRESRVEETIPIIISICQKTVHVRVLFTVDGQEKEVLIDVFETEVLKMADISSVGGEAVYVGSRTDASDGHGHRVKEKRIGRQ